MEDIRSLNDQDADAIGVMRFAAAMTRKLNRKRDEGKVGWNQEPYTVQTDRGDLVHRYGCTVAHLKRLLMEHVEKGDVVDIANFCMMIWNREHPEAE